MILLDTHVLVWWLTDQGKLTEKVRKLISRERKREGILVSAISVWEVAMLVKKGKLGLGEDSGEWLERLLELPVVKFVAVDERIAMETGLLSGFESGDSADRMILVTARRLGVSLVTKDNKMRKSGIAKTIW